jgi:hypothetical protein
VLYGSHHDFFVIINAMAVIIYYDCHRAIQNNYHCHSSIRNNSSFYSSIPEITVIITSSSPSSSPGILVRTAILTIPIILKNRLKSKYLRNITNNQVKVEYRPNITKLFKLVRDFFY